MESLDFRFFVGDVILRVVFRILAEVSGPWAPMPSTNVLTRGFIGN